MKNENLGSLPYLKRKCSQAHVVMRRTYCSRDSQDDAKEKKIVSHVRGLDIQYNRSQI